MKYIILTQFHTERTLTYLERINLKVDELTEDSMITDVRVIGYSTTTVKEAIINSVIIEYMS